MIGGSQSQEIELKGKFNDVPAFMTAIFRNLAADITTKRGCRGRTDCQRDVMSQRRIRVPVGRDSSGPE